MMGGQWFLLLFALVLLIAGGIVASWIVAGRQGSSSRAHEILAERYAAGELSTDELNERRGALGLPANRSRWWLLAGALLVVGVIGTAVAIGWGAGWSTMGGSIMGGDMGSMMGGGDTTRDAPAPQAGAETIEVTARDFSFTPSRLEATGGEPVNIEFHNDGPMFHTFTIEGEDFNLEAKAGDTVRAALELEPGTYDFICTVSGHASSGMRGSVVVRG